MLRPGPGHRVGKLIEQGRAPDDPLQGLAGLLPVLGEQSELPVRQGHAGPVAEFFSDGEGFVVPVVGLVQPPAFLGGPAELVVGARKGPPIPRTGPAGNPLNTSAGPPAPPRPAATPDAPATPARSARHPATTRPPPGRPRPSPPAAGQAQPHPQYQATATRPRAADMTACYARQQPATDAPESERKPQAGRHRGDCRIRADNGLLSTGPGWR